MKFVIVFLALLPLFSFGQNQLLPAKYFTYFDATSTIHDLDSFTEILSKSALINDSTKVRIKTLTKQKKLRCYHDLLAQCDYAITEYNGPVITDTKLNFLQHINKLRKKFEPLKKIDSVWYEYFRDTLNNIEKVQQYTGLKLCMREGNLVVKERIYIPINNTGQFYKNHYTQWELGEWISKALNRYLGTVKSVYRVCFSLIPPLYHPVTRKKLEDDGLAFVILNEEQCNNFDRHLDYFPGCNFFFTFCSKFDDYNTNGKKKQDIDHIKNSNMMWALDSPTQRSIVSIMEETFFDNFKEMIDSAHVNSSHIYTFWDVWPQAYKELVTDFVTFSKNKLKVTILYDGYPTCKKDSFIFKCEMNHKIYSGKYKYGSEFDFTFLKLLNDIAKDGFPNKKMFLASIDLINMNSKDLFYILVNSEEEEYIRSHKMMYLYDPMEL